MPKRPVALAEMPRQPGVALAAARSWAASMPAALRETTQASLSRKIATFYGLLLTLALGLVLVSSNFGISLVADHILGREFASESRVFESLREMRYDQMQHGAELLAADFGFRSAVATGDAPTIASALDSLGQRMGNGRALFIGTEGNVVGGGQDVTGADKTYLVDAVERGSTRGVLTLGGRYYAAVAASVNAPDQLGWILFISPLGKREMARLIATSAMPLHAQIVSADSLERDIPIVKAGSEVSVERRDLGERMLVQASSVADFGGGRPQVLVLEYSLSQALDAYAPMFRILLASCVAALVIAIAGSLYLARKLARPIEALGAAAERVSYGEFVRVEAGGDGEVADLIDAFNKMVAGIEDREHQIAQAQTRLELRIREVQQENMRLNAIAAQQRGAALAEAATALDAQLAPVLLTFDSEADRLFVAARDMRENLRAAKARASETGQSAQRTENATHLIAANAGELATSGKRIATEAGTTLDLVSRAANDSAVAAASFAGLRQAVQEITSVTDEIRAISGRTNMLAINATIEAARAGAAGRNFAVVAGEVKDLARQTAALTATIGDRLALVGQAATGADETLNQVRAALDSAAGVTGAIAGAARAQADATGGISQGISDIAVESRTAAESINQIEVAAGASVDMADQVQGSAETVASRAHQLRETVEQFLARLRLSAA